MAFQFSLAQVLRVREVLEEREERTLQQILVELAQSRECLADTVSEIAKTDDSRRSNILKPYMGLHIHAIYGEAEQLKKKRMEIESRIEKLEVLRERQLAAYDVARRNREMLTDMREEKCGVYEALASRREQKIVDDNYISRRGRF